MGSDKVCLLLRVLCIVVIFISSLTTIDGQNNRNTADDTPLQWSLTGDKLVVEGVGAITGVFDFHRGMVYPWIDVRGQFTQVVIGDRITSIGNEAFKGCQIKSVVFGRNVTSIGEMAFFNNQLTEVTFPNSLREIGDYCFQYNQLASVNIPNSVTTIGNGAFYVNPINRITIGSNVTFTRGSFEGAFNGSFDNFYIENGRQTGTYSATNGNWSRQTSTSVAPPPTEPARPTTTPSWMSLIPSYHSKFTTFVENGIETTKRIIENRIGKSDDSVAMQLLNSRQVDINENDLLAYKKVRTIRYDNLYPFFDCKFTQTNSGILFQKTGGSVRREGTLHKIDNKTYVVIGSHRADVGVDWSPGLLYKTDKDQLVIIFPYYENSNTPSGVELFEITK